MRRADIRRFLADQPISAQPPSTVYQARKFASRNKPLVGGAVGVTLALAAGLVSTTAFALSEAAQLSLETCDATFEELEAIASRINPTDVARNALETAALDRAVEEIQATYTGRTSNPNCQQAKPPLDPVQLRQQRPLLVPDRVALGGVVSVGGEVGQTRVVGVPAGGTALGLGGGSH